MRGTTKLVVFFVAAAFAAAPAMAQEKAAKPVAETAKPGLEKIPPGTSKTIVENDKVHVYEVRYKPGEGTEIRERPARVTRALTDGTMERIHADGKKELMNWKAGETKFFPKEKFGNKNVGKSELVLFVTALK